MNQMVLALVLFAAMYVLLLVFSDTYGRTRFQLDGVTNAIDIRDMNSWWKKRPARFSGRLDFAKVKQILDRSLA